MIVMIDEFVKLQTAVDPTIVDVEVTETIRNCSNSDNEQSEPTKEKADGNLRYLIKYFIFNLFIVNFY